jgi:hypothetical protein
MKNAVIVLWLLVTANVSNSPILVALLMRRYVPPKRRLLQEPRGVTSQKTAFFLTTVPNNDRWRA